MRYFLCLVLLILFTPAGSQAADAPGAAVFVRLTGNADDARSEVYEQRLSGGKAKVLVAHTALPKAFRGRIERALPAADGAFLLLEESRGFVIRNKKTGATRLVLGNGYSMDGANEVLAERFTGGYWLWKRGAGTLKKIPLLAKNEVMIGLQWSPRERLLLAHVSQSRPSHDIIRLYDPATGKIRNLRAGPESSFVSWSPNADAVLIGEQPNEKTTRLVLAPLNGKAQLLFTRTGRVFTGALSPDGRQVAIGDLDGFFLFSRDGRTKRTLAVPKARGIPAGNMVFSPDGKTLAIFSSSATGEPYVNIHEELWTVQTQTAAAQCVAQWDVTLGNAPGEDTTHVLLGWVPGQPALLVMGRSSTTAGPETEWQKLWLQPVDPARPATLFVDSGPCGIDMACWQGNP